MIFTITLIFGWIPALLYEVVCVIIRYVMYGETTHHNNKDFVKTWVHMFDSVGDVITKFETYK